MASEAKNKRERERYAENREAVLAHQRAYYAANSERIRERHRAYREANPEKVRESFSRSMAKPEVKAKAVDGIKRWAKSNRGRLRKAGKDWRLRHPEQALLAQAKSRARDFGLAFDITIEDVVIPEFCPVLPWLKLEMSTTGRCTDRSPSLDKMVPARGYVKGNVRVISMRANTLKRDASGEEMLRVAEYIYAIESASDSEVPNGL